MRCGPFASPDGLRTLDIIARRYGQRPSALAGVADPYYALLWDEAAAIVGLHDEAAAARSAHEDAGGAGPVAGAPASLSGFFPKVPEPDW